MGWHDPLLWVALQESDRRARKQFEPAAESRIMASESEPDPAGVPKAIRHEVARIAVPVSLEAVFQTLFGFVDQVIVGALGAAAIAAVGLVNSITFVVIIAYASLGAGCAILVSQAHGRRDSRDVSQFAALTFVLAALIASSTALPLVVWAGASLRLSGAEAEVINQGSNYLRGVGLALPLIVISAVASAVSRALGDARTPMVVTMCAVLLNTLLGVLLVFGVGPFPELGILGAAVATVIAQLVRSLFLTYFLYVRPDISVMVH